VSAAQFIDYIARHAINHWRDQRSNVDHWLDRATAGLPADSRGWVRDELRAHYDDALAQHLSDGASPDEARRLALAELGGAGAVSGGLRETHLAERRYAAAAAFSLIFPLSVLAHVLMQAQGAGGLDALIYDLLLLLPLLYILRALHTLLVQRHGIHVGRRIALVAAGALALTLPEALMDGYWIALSHGFGGSLSALGLGALNALLVIDLIGALLVGLGLIGLAEALLNVKALRGFCGAAFPAGLALALAFAASVSVSGGGLLPLAWLAAIGFGLLTHGAWAALFFRAARTRGAALTG
jgi:hypothetical protein